MRRERTRVAIYPRVSDEAQLEGYSIPAQLRALREYAHSQGWEIVAEYIEEGVSARSDKRPAFQKMIADAKRKPKPFDIILVHKLDRFARNRQDSVIYKSLLRQELGIDVHSMTEPIDDSATGRLNEGILEVIAEFYSANLSNEVLKGQRERALTGRGMCVPPVGYIRCKDPSAPDLDGKYIPDPDTSPIVKWIYDVYTSEIMGMGAIAKSLKLNGVQRFGPAAARFSWTVPFIKKILANRAYKGDLIWGQRDTRRKRELRPESEWVIITDAHEPLVEPQKWQLAQEIREGRGHSNLADPDNDYVFRQMLRCLDCGHTMIHYPYHLKSRTIRCAICTGYSRHHECYCNRVPLSDIEEAVFGYLRTVLEGRVPVDDIRVTRRSEKHNVDPIEETRLSIEGEEREYKRVWEAYKAGGLTLEEWLAEKRSHDERKAQLLADLATLEAERATNEAHKRTVAELREIIRDVIDQATNTRIPIPNRREALKRIIESIHISKRQDTVEIWFSI